MKSILVTDKKCWLCGRKGPEHLDLHHVWGGRGTRKVSDDYGLTVYLCHHTCHEYGPNAVHQNQETRKRLQDWSQKKAMEHYGWSLEDWMKVMRKNYLLED